MAGSVLKSGEDDSMLVTFIPVLLAQQTEPKGMHEAIQSSRQGPRASLILWGGGLSRQPTQRRKSTRSESLRDAACV